MKKNLNLLLLLVIPFLSSPGNAETVVVPVGQQAADKQAIQRPRQGATKDTVLSELGEPLQRNPAVGDPPISSWEYPDFVVYYEYDKVLHSVLKRDTASAE